MNTDHLSESEIQQYVFDSQHCEDNLVAHIQSCEHCRNKAEFYKTTFSQINTIETPEFDFNLTQLVMDQIAVEPAKKRFPLSLIIISVILTTVFFSTVTYVLAGNGFTPFNNTSEPFAYIITGLALLIIIFQSTEYFSKYRQLTKKYDLT